MSKKKISKRDFYSDEKSGHQYRAAKRQQEIKLMKRFDRQANKAKPQAHYSFNEEME